MAPCLLILEDLDSLIDNENRSFFLNELDGLESNVSTCVTSCPFHRLQRPRLRWVTQDGILLIGSTNHLERLDPALKNRPSRFDRKFQFNDPTLGERVLYCKYWKQKLESNESISFPDTLVEHLAKITDGFSFAYLKEAFVSSLVSLATGNDSGAFADVIERQIKTLKKELNHKVEDTEQEHTQVNSKQPSIISQGENRQAQSSGNPFSESTGQRRGLVDERNAWRMRTSNQSSDLSRSPHATFDPAF